MRSLPARTRPRLGPLLAVVAVGAMAFTACTGEDPAPSGRTEHRSAPSTPASPAPKPAQAVTRGLLTADQVGHGVRVQDDGSGVREPTNDVCGKRWATDTQRLARRQRFFWKDAKAVDLVVSHEVVAYRPGAAPGVLKEIEAAVDDCDGWRHRLGEFKEPRLTDPPASAPDDAVAWTATDVREGTELSYLAVYQVEGDVLSALYVWTTGSPSPARIADELTPKVTGRLEGMGD